ncbi:hypothetical protein [Flavobacterium sp.]|uniref:hypothetical protein n=1 Tax=Flavobacterium sp. TaxID=239 RepID=UPI003D2985F7
MNYLNLLTYQFETYEKSQIDSQEHFENIKKEVEFYSNKLKSFPHFEHHHINIFYEFNEERSIEINKNTTEITRDLFELIPEKGDTLEIINHKINEAKVLANRLKLNYEEHFLLYKNHINNVRNDLKVYL